MLTVYCLYLSKPAMSLEHQSQDHDLLTPEEAQRVIELYAEREKRRKEEAERIAAMPTLEDLSALLGLPLPKVRDLAYESRRQVDLPIELDEQGNEHIPQRLADLVIARAGQIEKAKQAEQERLAKMASLKDIASGLGINEVEAASLLKDVRESMAPPKIDPKVAAELERAELARQAAARRRMEMLLWTLGILILIWSLIDAPRIFRGKSSIDRDFPSPSADMQARPVKSPESLPLPAPRASGQPDSGDSAPRWLKGI